MDFTISAPKLLPGVQAFFESWLPNPTTTKWTVGVNGASYDGPIAACRGAGVDVSPELIAKYAERIRINYEDRGVLRPEVKTPTFNELSPLPNLWDHLHFSLALLDDLHEEGFEWAGHFAGEILQSYYLNKNTPWLRDGGDADYPNQAYGDHGRHRCVGWILHSLRHGHRIFKRAGELSKAAACLSFAWSHVDRIRKNGLLLEDPQGDGGPAGLERHARVFMTGILVSALRRLKRYGLETQDLIDRFLPIIYAARRGAARYAYDLAFDGETPKQVEGEIVNEGFGGVTIWIADALLAEPTVPPGGKFEPTYWNELYADAKARGFPSKYPMHMLLYLGRL